jgi:ABC-type transport system substrate-binding protein
MRRRKCWPAAVLVLAALCALAAGLAACGSSDSGGGTGGGGSGDSPVNGGTLTVSFQGEPTGLDPAVAWEVESWSIEHCIFNQLLTWEPGTGPATLMADLATEVPTTENGGITNDGKTYTYHLRKGVMFQAPVSREVTAQDFKYSFERMMNPKEVPLAPAGYLYEGVVGVQEFVDGKADEITGFKVIDDSTIQIDLVEPSYVFNMVMAQPFTAVMAKEWVEKYNSRTIARHPLGTGPFVFDHWTNGQEIVLTKNPDYFDSGKPYLDQIDLKFAASASTAVLQLQRGDIDVLGSGIPSAEYVRISNDPKWKQHVYTAPQVAWYYVFMNVNVKPFDDVKVRQAVNYAIDTAKIQKLQYGQAEALNQVYPKGMEGHVEGAQFYTYDPAKAKQLLSEAGFPNGFEVTFYTHNVDPMPKLAQSVQNDLAAVGIKAGIKQMAESPYWNLISRMDADIPIGLSDWYMDFPDPSDWIGPLFSKASAETDGGANASWWWNQQVEDLSAQATPMEPSAERTKLFEQMQEIIMEEAPTAPLFQPIQTTMASPNTGGFYTSAIWTFDFPSYWKIDGQ